MLPCGVVTCPDAPKICAMTHDHYWQAHRVSPSSCICSVFGSTCTGHLAGRAVGKLLLIAHSCHAAFRAANDMMCKQHVACRWGCHLPINCKRPIVCIFPQELWQGGRISIPDHKKFICIYKCNPLMPSSAGTAIVMSLKQRLGA